MRHDKPDGSQRLPDAAAYYGSRSATALDKTLIDQLAHRPYHGLASHGKAPDKLRFARKGLLVATFLDFIAQRLDYGAVQRHRTAL